MSPSARASSHVPPPCRRNRLQTVPGQLGYEPLRDSNEGMSPAQMRALPVVMHEKRHSSFRRHNSG